MKYEMLLSPLKVGSIELKNRFVVPAMGTNYPNYDGTLSQQSIDYYTARAKGGYGLIITEVTAVKPNGKAILREPGIWDDFQIPSHKAMTDSVHAAGGKIFCQLHHCGRQTFPLFIGNEMPVAPSAVPCPSDDAITHEMTSEECWEMVEAFGDAAVRAKKAGYDGVEVHGGHGYLIAQFMSPHANKRIDEWGGTLDGRLKFPREVFKNIREKCGRDYPISFRFSHDEMVNGGRTIEESTVIARMAEECEVDMLNVTIMTYASTEYMSATPHMATGFNQHPTSIIKKSVNIPVATVGRINNALIAEDILLGGRADLIVTGRASIADPEFPNKVRDGKLDDQIPCIGCTQGCVSRLGKPERDFKIGCLVNPVTGHEGEYDLSPVADENKKKVLVVGGGPAGLVAAMTAALKGHKVTLCEATDHFGGKFRLAAVPPTQHEIAGALKYYISQCKKHGVEMLLNCEVTEEYLAANKFDAVILATGSKIAMPDIPGINNPNFLTIHDILSGKATTGPLVLMAGGGMAACETADFLCEHNKIVTMVEMNPMLAMDADMGPRRFLMQRLNGWTHSLNNVGPALNVVTNAKIVEFFDDGVAFEIGGVRQEIHGHTTVVLSLGAVAYNPLEETAKKYCDKVTVVGDAITAGNADVAVEGGFLAALNL